MFEVYYRDYYGREIQMASFRFLVDAENYISVLHKQSSDRYFIRFPDTKDK